MLKRIATLSLCILLAAATVLAEGGTFDVQYEVTYNQTEARKMVSDYRKKFGDDYHG